MRQLLATEAAMWRNLFAWVLRRPAPDEQGFGYHGVVKPILGVFIGLSAVEIPVFDLIVRKVVPWEPARWIVLVLGVWGLLWMIGFAAGLQRHPHVVGDDGIRVRLGNGIDFTVPWTEIASVSKRYRSLPSSKSVQIEDGAVHIAMASQTSVDIVLRPGADVRAFKGAPLPALDKAAGAAESKAEISAVRIYADQPDELIAAARAKQPEPA
ncbi:hypothetical protein AB0J83_21430 [Actinoplanes sp. NPDC049596]|uniref:hypothetical protein n=1 Tax=unclassified Actinoplanes TaxID=2626549 RepID=UPI0034178F89